MHPLRGAPTLAWRSLELVQNLGQVTGVSSAERALDEIERARVQESVAWEGYYGGQYAVAKAKLNLLRSTGDLIAALR